MSRSLLSIAFSPTSTFLPSAPWLRRAEPELRWRSGYRGLLQILVPPMRLSPPRRPRWLHLFPPVFAPTCWPQLPLPTAAGSCPFDGLLCDPSVLVKGLGSLSLLSVASGGTTEVPLPADDALQDVGFIWVASLDLERDGNDEDLVPRSPLASSEDVVSGLVHDTVDVCHDEEVPAEHRDNPSAGASALRDEHDGCQFAFMRMELAQLVANLVEEASRPLREEVASLKLMLARVGVSLEPPEACSSDGQEIATVQALFPLGSAGLNSSVVEITQDLHEVCGDSSVVLELLELSGGVAMPPSIDEVRSDSHEISAVTSSPS
ncbi:hypothetical protein QYE76_023292 [Lolium multiflorum]|uniref:Uncharacterized protein n=1 Tax=Lolium multiflorum TaxID=4521 RepID=A0AAD8RA77_LOLMU|nr:hypothetical protein QYE76_023292 [Lolium multiflorum]